MYQDTGKKDVELTLAGGGRICIAVEDAEGNRLPVERLQVFAPDTDTPLSDIRRGAKWGGPGGLCSFAVPPGDYQVKVGESIGYFIPQWWPGREDRRLAETITVGRGDSSKLTMKPVTPTGNAALEMPGYAHAREESVAIEIMKVPNKGEEVGEETEWETVPDDRWKVDRGKKGRGLRVVGVPVGTYRFRVSVVAGGKARSWRSKEPTRIRPGDWTEVTLALEAPAPSPDTPKTEPAATPHEGSPPTPETAARRPSQ